LLLMGGGFHGLPVVSLLYSHYGLYLLRKLMHKYTLMVYGMQYLYATSVKSIYYVFEPSITLVSNAYTKPPVYSDERLDGGLLKYI
jgi:hypothetical protein